MGNASRQDNVMFCLRSLAEVLADEGLAVSGAAAEAAARAALTAE
jgi:hypothetical protein